MSNTSTLIEPLIISEISGCVERVLPYREIGYLIRNYRKEAGITQDQLAKKIGTSKSYISKIESGNADIQISTLIRIIEIGFERKLVFNIL